MFCCVDSFGTRKLLWESLRQRTALFLDGRMSTEVIRVLAVASSAIDRYYATTLFDASHAYAGACTARSTTYTASIAAGLIVGQLTKWRWWPPADRDLTFNPTGRRTWFSGRLRHPVEGRYFPITALQWHLFKRHQATGSSGAARGRTFTRYGESFGPFSNRPRLGSDRGRLSFPTRATLRGRQFFLSYQPGIVAGPRSIQCRSPDRILSEYRSDVGRDSASATTR